MVEIKAVHLRVSSDRQGKVRLYTASQSGSGASLFGPEWEGGAWREKGEALEGRSQDGREWGCGLRGEDLERR